MVKVKDRDFYSADGQIDLDIWLKHIASEYNEQDIRLITDACTIAKLADEHHPHHPSGSCLQQGLAVAEILHSLQTDATALATSILYFAVQFGAIDADDISEQFNTTIAKLIHDVEQLGEVGLIQRKAALHRQNRRHLDNLRKMLVNLVEDVRVVLIKLAEQTVNMRRAPKLGQQYAKQLAQETIDIYAPLANRLGISHIKWQLEDLAFRYLETDNYHTIAKSLDSKRVEREQFIQEAINIIEEKLIASEMKHYEINGRAKHIYSIARKMARKHVGIEEIYDALAVRVLTQNVEDCYAVLGIVHSLWEQIPQEFDDYIATPKPNGYQSIHTAVVGPGHKNLEVQIRTHDMHKESELGVAAHWHYKEGGKKPSHEGKIAWLRQVLDWQKELINPQDDPLDQTIEDDRIYVLTPKGEIKDLPTGATPLDFAYQIHSEVGHRCRGAKINGTIVPLNYVLKTGEQVDILTTKYPQPSRDWINPHLGYLNSSRARAKVIHWFKQQDYEKNKEDGLQLLRVELQRLHLSVPDDDVLLNKFNYKTIDDCYAAIGNGDLRITQIIGLLQAKQQAEKKQTQPLVISKPKRQHQLGDIHIAGVGNLLTHIARCCQPVPGETIIGFITRGRGVSIHRQDCTNIIQASESNRQRLIEVEWEQEVRNNYPVNVSIHAHDRKNLVRDVTSLLSNEDINLINLHTSTDKKENSAHMSLTIEVDDLQQLSRILDRIQQLPNIVEVRREELGS